MATEPDAPPAHSSEEAGERFTPGTILAERYRIVTPLGRGGMGEVYRADDLKLRQTVALKFLPRSLTGDARLLETLYNEVRQARLVSHHHVCRVHDIGEAEGQPFLTMEFIEGEDLGSLLRRIGRLPRDKALELGRQLCSGLAAAHAEGLLHLDLKPGNLMIDRRGELRVTDFGLARLGSEVAAEGTMRAGTPAYMAPEQILGEPLSERTDLYAVGLILFEMLSGRRLHDRRSVQEIAEWHATAGEPDLAGGLPSGLDPALTVILESCLRHDPGQRPDSASALLAELEALDRPEPIAPPTRAEGPPSSSGKILAALMFTDIVGSVELQQRLGTGAYTRFVARHDAIFKECLERAPGASVLNETGDGYLVRFADPADAVNTALRLQWRFAGENVDGAPIRVRIGLNMGVVTEMTETIRGERRVVGMPINIASRVMDLAEGGQILLTRSVYDDARHHVREHPDETGGELRWISHGNFHFKGGDQPLEIFEVGLEGMAPLAPPADSAKAWHERSPSGGGAGASGEERDGDDEPISVHDIEGSDVIISYAPVDDLPLSPGSEGWVTRFHRNLSVRLEQLCGEHVNVLRCPRRSEQELVDSLIPSVGRVRTMVPVVSPPFIKSDKCRRIVEAFGEGGASGPTRKELLKAVKTPISRDEIPARLATMLGGSLDYNFYDEDPESGRLREFDEAFGPDAQKRYYERVYDLAFEVSKNLKAARKAAAEPDGDATSDSKGKRTVFLAEATSDLQDARDRLRRDLLDQGHAVLPDRPLPMEAEELERELAGYLERCDFAIHFVGGRYGWIPDGASESLAILQNLAAAKRSAEAGLKRVVWIPRDVEPSNERQAAFLEDLAENPESHCGAEVVRDTLENLKGYIRDQWKAEDEARRKREAAAETASGSDASGRDDGSASTACPRLYLICDPKDEAAVEALEDFFFDRGIEVSLPAFSGSEAEISEIHWGNLADCDAALVYYGASGKAWVDYKLRELVKAAGYRKGKPIDLQSVYVAPPFDRRKERFRSLSADVVRQDGETFVPERLEDFVRAIKEASTSETPPTPAA